MVEDPDRFFEENCRRAGMIACVLNKKMGLGLDWREAQQVGMLTLWKQVHRWEGPAPLMSMMWKMIRYALIDEARTLRWFHGSLNRDDEHAYTVPSEIKDVHPAYAHDYDLVETLIDLDALELPTKQRIAMRMLGKGYAPFEVADHIGVSRPSVSLYRRALRKAYHST